MATTASRSGSSGPGIDERPEPARAARPRGRPGPASGHLATTTRSRASRPLLPRDDGMRGLSSGRSYEQERRRGPGRPTGRRGGTLGPAGRSVARRWCSRDQDCETPPVRLPLSAAGGGGGCAPSTTARPGPSRPSPSRRPSNARRRCGSSRWSRPTTTTRRALAEEAMFRAGLHALHGHPARTACSRSYGAVLRRSCAPGPESGPRRGRGRRARETAGRRSLAERCRGVASCPVRTVPIAAEQTL